MTFRLGEWRVEPSLRRISKDGFEVRLEPKVMELLVLLASRPGQVVVQDEIERTLWPGIFVTRSSVFRHVSELRRALGDDRRQPRFIETIPKKGYRLVAAVAPAAETPATPSRLVALSLSAVAVVVVTLALLTARTSVSPAANGAFLRGELYEDRLDCSSFERAVAEYEEALSRDDRFIEAYPRLLDARLATAVMGCGPPGPLFEEMERLLDRADRQGLDEDRYRQGVAALTLWRDGDVSEALARFQSSREDPVDFSYAVALVLSGREDDAVAEARRCLSALPVDLGENWGTGGVLYLAGRYDDAAAQFLDTLELYPGFRPALQMLALSYWMAGDRDKALETAAKGEPGDGERWTRFDALPGYVYAAAGQRERARAILDRWIERSRSAWVPKTSLALLHLGLGESDEARRWLEEARAERDPWLSVLRRDPAFAPLRSSDAEHGGEGMVVPLAFVEDALEK
jgi:DNA-binding winged helix-turn-helix (wHTH) protein/tetratricopeptide (TPR) repeat protein